MTSAKKGWPVLLAVLLLSVPFARGADDLNGAILPLARKTAALAGRGETIAVTYRNVSSLAPVEWNGVRTAFESALRESGSRAGETGAVEARLTVSESPSQYLLVEEVRKGDERQIWIASWDRAAPAANKPMGVSLDLKQVWRQPEQILDIAFVPAGMLTLSPRKLTLYARNGETWAASQSMPISNAKPWPRDLRGRLRAAGTTFQVFLPGLACNGNTDGSLSLDCRASEAPWVLESGAHGLLLATFASGRNYFDGRVVTQTGARKTVPPFYSAASVESQGRTLWIMAQTDGHAQIADASLDPVGVIAEWGSDIVGIEARCGGAAQVLATRPGDRGEPDALQSFIIADHAAAPVTAAALLPGPITALWPSAPGAALAVARDALSGEFIAYVATVSCAN